MTSEGRRTILSPKRCPSSRKSVLFLLVLAPARFARSEASRPNPARLWREAEIADTFQQAAFDSIQLQRAGEVAQGVRLKIDNGSLPLYSGSPF
jgi:hypothetical protein